jgi:hypothetical protein
LWNYNQFNIHGLCFICFSHSKILGCDFPKSSVIKRTKKKAIERQTQIVAKICQNRTADKGQFFRGVSVAQIKKCKTNESLDITWGICTRNYRSKRCSGNFHEFLRCSSKICFRTATFPNLTSLKLEVSLGTTMK